MKFIIKVILFILINSLFAIKQHGFGTESDGKQKLSVGKHKLRTNIKNLNITVPTSFSTVLNFNKGYDYLVNSGQSGGFIYEIFHKNGTPIASYNTGSCGVLDQNWNPDTIAALQSMSKSITAMGIIKLIEDGKISSIDDEAQKYWKAFKTPNVYVGKDKNNKTITEPAKSNITIRDLITHTSGLSQAGLGIIGAMQGNQVDKDYTLTMLKNLAIFPKNKQMLLDVVTKDPLSFQPGEGWQYSNGIDVLGVIITEITGTSLFDQLDKVLFKPMGMSDTYFQHNVPELKWLTRTADTYLTSLKHHVPLDIMQSTISNENFELGGQGLYSTLNNYKKFALMLVNQGLQNNKRIFKEETINDYVFTSILPKNAKYITSLPLYGLEATNMKNSGKEYWSAPGTLSLQGDISWGGAGGMLWRCNKNSGICQVSWSNDIMPAYNPSLQSMYAELRANKFTGR